MLLKEKTKDVQSLGKRFIQMPALKNNVVVTKFPGIDASPASRIPRKQI